MFYKSVQRLTTMYRELAGFKSSEQVYTVDYTFGGSNTKFNNYLMYEYDDNGNITSISKNGVLQQSYVYDDAGQLIRANDAQRGKTYTYDYDGGGNITRKLEFSYTTGWLDPIWASASATYSPFNMSGQKDDRITYYKDFDNYSYDILYDGIGNPIKITNREGTTTKKNWNSTWEAGRQLSGMYKTNVNINFKYNDEGIRTEKYANGSTTRFTLVDDRITAQETGGVYTYFRYDQNNELIAMNWNGNEYFYVRNIQKDIIGLVDENGNLVVEYTYDAWGNPISVTGSMANTLGAANPFRYRGYYYDVETGYYYLQSLYGV